MRTRSSGRAVPLPARPHRRVHGGRLHEAQEACANEELRRHTALR